jgi:ribonuclease HI
VEHLEKSKLASMAKCYRISSGYQYESKASAVRLEYANSRKIHCCVTENSVAVNSANHLQTVAAQGAVTAQIRWKKPQQGRLKCNVDAAFSEALNCVGFGIYIHDVAGNFIKAKTMWSNPVCSSDVGEALGLLYAIKWMHELQFTNVDFELDAKKVVDYFNRGHNDVFEFGAIMDACRQIHNSYFENSKAEFSR